MSRDYQGPYYSLDDLRSVIDAMCKSIESSGLIDEHEHPSAYSALLDTSKWMAELEGQEPVAWMTANREMTSFVNFHDDDLPLYARPVPAEPVNARLLTALKACRHQFAHYVAHHISKGDMHKAMANESMVAMADVAIMAAEAAPRVARLTMGECMQAVKHFSFEEMTLFGIARAIEVAVLRKNGIEVAE